MWVNFSKETNNNNNNKREKVYIQEITEITKRDKYVQKSTIKYMKQREAEKRYKDL